MKRLKVIAVKPKVQDGINMEGYTPLTLKSFRGGISSEGDKGPTGSFKFGKNLDIHGGEDTLKCNQKMKLDQMVGEETVGDLPMVMISTSDGKKYAFGDTGKIYRRDDGGWRNVYNASERISGAIEYQSTTDTWILFTTDSRLFKIRLVDASSVNTWTSEVELVGNIDDRSFVVNFSDSKRSRWARGTINPKDPTIKPELTISKRVASAGADTTISTSITVPDEEDQVLVVIAGRYGGSESVTTIEVNTVEMDSEASGSATAGGFSISQTVKSKVAPTVGVNNIVVNFGGSSENRFLYAFVFKGVDQTDPISEAETTWPDEGSGASSISTIQSSIMARNSIGFGFIGAEQTTINSFTGEEIQDGNTGTVGTDALYYFKGRSYESDHPMNFVGGSVIIANGRQMALYDFQDAYNGNALALPPNLIATSLLNRMSEGTDKSIIACRDITNSNSWIVTWDGSSISWLDKKPIKGDVVNSMGFLEEGVILQAGDKGNFKYWNYGEIVPFDELPGVESSNYGGITEYRSLTLFGLNGGVKNGVYSFGRFETNKPLAINLEYIPSHGQTEDCEIGSLLGDGDDLYIGWKRTYTPEGGSATIEYGIDIIDHDNKAVAVYESLELTMGNSHVDKLIKEVKVLLAETIPTGAKVKIEVRATNTPSDWTQVEMGNGQDEIISGKKGIFDIEAQGEVYEVRVTLTPTGNETPKIRSVSNFYSQLNSI